MDIVIGLLIAFVIAIIAVMRYKSQRSQKQSHQPDNPTGNKRTSSATSSAAKQTTQNTVKKDNRVEEVSVRRETPSISEPETPYHTRPPSEKTTKVSEPSDYPNSWKDTSRKYREEKRWQCEMCKISLHQHKHYLHTHHIYGTRYDDLEALCIGCHSEQPGINHLLLKETPEYQGFIARYGEIWKMSHISDFHGIRNKFRKYVKHESNILEYIGSSGAFIKYESDCRKENGSRVVWISAWIPDNANKISTSISIDGNSRFFQAQYQKLKEQKNNIEETFLFQTITPIKAGSNIYQLRVEKRDVDLTQIANLDANFRWLRENLEKLYWVLRAHDTLDWDTPLSTLK